MCVDGNTSGLRDLLRSSTRPNLLNVVNRGLSRANHFSLQNDKKIEMLDTTVHFTGPCGPVGADTKVSTCYRLSTIDSKQSAISYARILKNNAKRAGT
jgi:hypothetical protein